MDLALSDDQRAILDALDVLCRPYEAAPMHDVPLAAASAALERELLEGGFLDVALDPDLGCVTAALVVERLARLPFAVEAAQWALVRPVLGEGLAYPLCMVEAGRERRPLRYLREGASVVLVGESVTEFIAAPGQFRAEPEALFAYPVASLLMHLEVERSSPLPEGEGLGERAPPSNHRRILPPGLPLQGEEKVAPIGGGRTLAASPAAVLTSWRIGLAAETAGLLAAALASTAAHVSDRQQFGRPLATFQALRHRLAEAQVRTNGVRWLALKAAASLDPGDAALAALHAAESARVCVYDFHQFLGAMGMTLEHPLHLWTYRLKLLGGELGGRGAQALAAARAVWG